MYDATKSAVNVTTMGTAGHLSHALAANNAGSPADTPAQQISEPHSIPKTPANLASNLQSNPLERPTTYATYAPLFLARIKVYTRPAILRQPEQRRVPRSLGIRYNLWRLALNISSRMFIQMSNWRKG